MGGRGASSGFSFDKNGNPKNKYGSQYHTVLQSGDVFATFSAEQADDVTGKIVLDRYDIVAAGEYTGVLTFTVKVSDGAQE